MSVTECTSYTQGGVPSAEGNLYFNHRYAEGSSYSWLRSRVTTTTNVWCIYPNGSMSNITSGTSGCYRPVIRLG